MTLNAKQYAAIAEWCSRVRAKIGASPVERLHKGKPRDAARCVLAKTVNHRVSLGKRVRIDEADVYRGDDPFKPDELVAKTPEYVERFIREFDRGEHPELVGRGWARGPAS